MKTEKLVKIFFPYLKKYKRIIFFDLLCASLTTVCELVFPLIVRKITNTAINAPQNLTLKLVFSCAFLYLLLRLIDTAANYYMADMGHVMGSEIETDMRHDMFNHLLGLSYSYFQDAKVGKIMSRITSDLFDITEFAHHAPEEFFIVGLKVTVSFIILLNISVPLTIIVFAIIPFMVYFSLRYRKDMHRAFKAQRKQIGELNADIEDTLLGIRVVKSFANEEIEEAKFEKGNKKFLGIKKETYKYMARFQCTSRFFDGLLYITVVAAGGVFMIKGVVNSADIVAYLLYVSTLLASVRVIINFMEQFERGITGIERFAEIMEIKPTVTDKENAEPCEEFKGEIEFKNVTFGYGEGRKEVLHKLSFKIDVGENAAIVGPSGSGKTTVCNLIPRFYEPESGEILIDGKNINDIKLKDLRKNIGIVQQDVYLFSGSVFENIAYGKPGASREEVIAAARLAGAEEFINLLPNKYDTYVGERGVKLSGGQKQRISIARVFLKNPPVLILDEATSSLDNESEKVVQESLESLSKGRTVLTIAHRLTTVKNCDEIFVLTKKGIEEKGTHENLMNKKGLYYKLYRN